MNINDMESELRKLALQKKREDIELLSENYNGERLYIGVFKEKGQCVGYPLIMTMRGDKPYIFDDEEVLQILASLPD